MRKTVLLLVIAAPLFSSTYAAPSQLKCFNQYASIRGSSNGDVLIGTPGRNTIRAGKGKDAVFAGGGQDLVCGNKHDDTLVGGDGFDKVDGGRGFDVCEAEVTRHCEQRL